MKLQTTFLDPRAKREDDSVFLSISVSFIALSGQKFYPTGFLVIKKSRRLPTAWARITTVGSSETLDFNDRIFCPVQSP